MKQILFGVELGMAHQFTAVSILEQDGDSYTLRELNRYPLRTRYSRIAKDVRAAREAVIRQGSEYVIVIDETGTGPEVSSLFSDDGDDIQSITISAGSEVKQAGWRASVPRRNIIQSVQLPLQEGNLKFAQGLSYKDVFLAELASFKMKPASVDTSSFDTWREGELDDLVLAVCLPIWASKNWGFEASFAVAMPEFYLPGQKNIRRAGEKLGWLPQGKADDATCF